MTAFCDLKMETRKTCKAIVPFEWVSTECPKCWESFRPCLGAAGLRAFLHPQLLMVWFSFVTWCPWKLNPFVHKFRKIKDKNTNPPQWGEMLEFLTLLLGETHLAQHQDGLCWHWGVWRRIPVRKYCCPTPQCIHCQDCDCLCWFEVGIKPFQSDTQPSGTLLPPLNLSLTWLWVFSETIKRIIYEIPRSII